VGSITSFRNAQWTCPRSSSVDDDTRFHVLNGFRLTAGVAGDDRFAGCGCLEKNHSESLEQCAHSNGWHQEHVRCCNAGARLVRSGIARGNMIQSPSCSSAESLSTRRRSSPPPAHTSATGNPSDRSLCRTRIPMAWFLRGSIPASWRASPIAPPPLIRAYRTRMGPATRATASCSGQFTREQPCSSRICFGASIRTLAAGGGEGDSPASWISASASDRS
jgi:hypothetical protein